VLTHIRFISSQLGLMATVSAAGLAFSHIDDSGWGARGCFASALGVALIGAIVLHALNYFKERMIAYENRCTVENILRSSPLLRHFLSCIFASPAAICWWSVVLILCGLTLFTWSIGENFDSSRSVPKGKDIIYFRCLIWVPIMIAFSPLLGLGVAEYWVLRHSVKMKTSSCEGEDGCGSKA
jgi:hypothetical protein